MFFAPGVLQPSLGCCAIPFRVLLLLLLNTSRIGRTVCHHFRSCPGRGVHAGLSRRCCHRSKSGSSFWGEATAKSGDIITYVHRPKRHSTRSGRT
jgi:hypothetical protein